MPKPHHTYKNVDTLNVNQNLSIHKLVYIITPKNVTELQAVAAAYGFKGASDKSANSTDAGRMEYLFDLYGQYTADLLSKPKASKVKANVPVKSANL